VTRSHTVKNISARNDTIHVRIEAERGARLRDPHRGRVNRQHRRQVAQKNVSFAVLAEQNSAATTQIDMVTRLCEVVKPARANSRDHAPII